MIRTSLALFVCLTFLNSPTGLAQETANQVTANQVTANQVTEKLEQQLKEMAPKTLLAKIQQRGDAKRGALVFYKSAAACVNCHGDGAEQSPLGPKLTTITKEATDQEATDQDVTQQYIINAILYPSQAIKAGYETVNILTVDGDTVSGLVAEESDTEIVLRDASDLQKEIVVAKDDIDVIKKSDVSMMPNGLVSSLRTEREFYDLARYVIEVARGGDAVAAQLKPSAEQLAVKDDTQDLDHAGILEGLRQQDFKAGNRIYQSHCVNCHGSDGNQPSLATARAFGTQPMKYGADPFRMLATLTRGNGLMAPMQHLTPKERYQVIYFIREKFMKGRNPGYIAIDETYLASLPKGTKSGELELGADRDFGPVLGSQLGADINSSLTFRLADEITVNYDLHRFRLGGAWQGGFLDLSQTQHYRQRGEQMPQPTGTSIPGLETYGWQLGDSYELPSNAKPPRGPVRSDWAKYHGHYLYGDRAIMSYAIGGRDVLETIASSKLYQFPLLEHTLRIAAGDQPLKLCIGKPGQRDGQTGVIRTGESIVTSRSGIARDHVVVAPAASAKNYETSSSKNLARHIVRGDQARSLDLGTPGRTAIVRFRTRKGGTLIASTPENGDWAPNGKTLFVRGKRLVFDIGWVGAITGKSAVADNKWHTAAIHVGKEKTQLFVDGKLEAEKPEFRRDPEKNHVLKIGATATNFGGDLDGEVEWAAICEGNVSTQQLKEWTRSAVMPKAKSRWTWKPDDSAPLEAAEGDETNDGPIYGMAAVNGDATGMTWEVADDDYLMLTIPPSDRPRVVRIIRGSAPLKQLDQFQSYVAASSAVPPIDPQQLTRGGPERWPETMTLSGTLGQPANGYALDTIPIPLNNPWNAWLRTSALDFFDDGRCVVTTHGGDVYVISGIDDGLEDVTWKRFVAGLFEPFGVRVVDDQIYVTCRDGLKRLHDYDGNGEADFVEAFWIDDDVSSKFHAYNFDLQTDSQGNFYFAKAGQYTNHHRPGTIMKVPPEGGRADVVAWGIRTPNGMGKLNDDRFTVSDNQGPWMPAGKISLIEPNGFMGNMPINKEQDAWLREKHDGKLPETFDEPFIWMPQELDNSCGGQAWATDDRWGPLSGRLIHSSFGKGWLYYLSMQEIDGKTQSSIVALPHQWDAGVMRLRVNPKDGQMYGTGLSGWQGPNGGKDGCLQRLRYSGDPVQMIEKTRVVPNGIELTFNFKLADNAIDPANWNAEMWDYLWSRKYGSDQFSVLKPGTQGRDKLNIERVNLSNGNRTVTLVAPDLSVCDQLHITIELEDAQGSTFAEEVYFTIHNIPEE